MRPLISVIVLNFEGENLLDDCLSSLAAQAWDSYEVIVADNGSTDASGSVAARYPVRWAPLGKNFGFAAGNNRAAGHARGDVLVFVNNDMRFAPTFVAELVPPILECPEVFAADAHQYDWGGRHAIHMATSVTRRGLLRSCTAPSEGMGRVVVEQKPAAHIVEVVHACGGNVAVRRRMFESLGGFDERFVAGWEDVDICWRAWLMGWKSVFCPSAVCYHHVGVASGTARGSVVRYSGALGGRVIFATKHLPIADALTVWGTAFVGGLRDTFEGRPADARRRFAVLADAVREVPSAVRERRTVYRMAGISPRGHIVCLGTVGRAHGPVIRAAMSQAET